ncbi:glycosyltransferase [Desulfothermobacter acidiphilus]|uniref:glycosyltransferase n=1 Tax=Desulfothermobacter acidiphilus TaxID=1938353 RepID=UPI003F88DDC1
MTFILYYNKEGFGIACLEVQICGTPVVAYGKGGVEDTVVPATGDNWESATGLFFLEQSVEALEAAVKQFLAWEDHFRPEVLRRNAERFSRDRFKEEIVAFVRKKWEEFCPEEVGRVPEEAADSVSATRVIARATAVIAGFTLLSKVLGFVREMALTRAWRTCSGALQILFALADSLGARNDFAGLVLQMDFRSRGRKLCWLLAIACLAAIAYFSNQPFAEQDLRPEIERHPGLMERVRELPPVSFSYSGQPVDSRRAPAVLVASSRRIREDLGWRPRYGDLETIVRTAWGWHQRNPEGYCE